MKKGIATIDSKPLENLNRELAKIGEQLAAKAAQIETPVTQWLVVGANDIRNTIISSMRDTPQTGQHYKRGGKIHIASSPGNPPAVDSGELIRSIFYEVRNMEVEVGNLGGAPYYAALENGAVIKRGTGVAVIEPRPSLGPAVDKHKDDIVRNVGQEVIHIIGNIFK